MVPLWLWLWRVLGPHTLPSFLAFAAFLAAGFFIRFRRDGRTALELTCIAWQLTFCDIVLGVVLCFRIIGGPPPPGYFVIP